MLGEERKQLEDFNRELMMANGEYEELKEKLDKLGLKIFGRKVKIDELLNGKAKRDVET